MRPGLTVTPLAQSTARPGELELLARRRPLGRPVLPEHIADAVLFYGSARAELVTGTSLDVDGGPGARATRIAEGGSPSREQGTALPPAEPAVGPASRGT